MRFSLPTAVFALLVGSPSLFAGLYYSGETFAELPSQWRGFLLDQRTLRTIAVKPSGAVPAGPIRKRYAQEAARLTKLTQQRKLTADERADWGALYIRLGDPARAVEVMRTVQRENPMHFHLAANLGLAWQMQGDLAQAAACLEQAVRLAPAKLLPAEKLHLKLVRLLRSAAERHARSRRPFRHPLRWPQWQVRAGKIARKCHRPGATTRAVVAVRRSTAVATG